MNTSQAVRNNLRRRHRAAALFRLACLLTTLFGLLMLVLLLWSIASQGLGKLDWQFITSFPSRFPEKAGIKPALVGSLWTMALTALIAVPIGVAAAVYLEEYARPNRLNTVIEINIANLAGVPSIVYGLLGLVVFVRGLQLGRSVLAGSLALALLVLPVIIIASREAIRAVPSSLRQAAYALGATKWQTVRHHVLPVAMPGILTSIILALSRAIGEAAPLITIGALSFVPFVPRGLLDQFTVMPIQIFGWASRPQPAFQEVAAAGILVLLLVLLTMNAVAVALRNRFERNRRW